MLKQDALSKFKKINTIYFRPYTLINYSMDILQFFEFYHDIQDVESFETDHVEKWLEHLHESGLSSNTVNNKYYAVKSLYDSLNEETDIKVNPTVGVELPKRKTGILPVVDRITMFKLREAMKDNIRDRTILETFYATGARSQELCDIQISHLRLGDRQIVIPKGKELKPRIIVFTPYCQEWIRTYLSTRHDDSPYLFITKLKGPFIRQSMWQLMMLYSKSIKLKKNMSPNAFRRTFATILYKNGVPIHYISLLMGHASIKNTERYIKMDFADFI